MSMKELIEEWLKTKKGNLGIKTYNEYKRECKNIIDSIGHIKIKNINVKILEDFYNELKTAEGRGRNKKGFSDKTIKHHYGLITEILDSAVKWEYIFSNPNKKVAPIKIHKKKIECFSPEEVEKLLKVLKNEPIKYQALIYFAIDSGARMGEITGLTWEDIDLKTGRVEINKTTQYVAGYGVIEKRPKTNSSIRAFYITKQTIELLKQYKKEQNINKMKLGNQWGNSKRVFMSDFGEDMHPHRPYKILQRIIKKYNLKKVGFHSLRHTSASLQINAGIQHQIISRKLGHSSVSITDTIYSHFYDEEFQDVANTMENVLNIKII